MTRNTRRVVVVTAMLVAATAAAAQPDRRAPRDAGVAAPQVSRARQIPFIAGAGAGGAGLFDPEIGVVESGALNDVQATVSHDRKYVTLNMRPSLSSLQALREFTFQSNALPPGVNGGFVGGAGNNPGPVAPPAVAPAPRAAANEEDGDVDRVSGRTARALQPQARPRPRAAAPAAAPAPAARPKPEPSVLSRPGMTRVASLAE